MAALPEFDSFDLNTEPASLGLLWKRWTSRLENLFLAIKVTDEKRQKSLLLHYGGADLMILSETLLADTDETYKLAKVKFDAYFEPKINTTFETYNFRCMRQEDDETVDQFHTRLRSAAIRCDFHDVDREIRDQIVMHCSSSNLRKKALRDDLDLSNVLKIARSSERSERQATLWKQRTKLTVYSAIINR